jgi:methionyl aminopeptidase
VIVLRSAREVARIREAGRLVAEVLAAVRDAAGPGVRPVDLDRLAARMLADAGAVSSFLHYHPRWAPMPYPAVICLSVNEAIVHGIPDTRPLRAGDVLSIDFGAAIDGLHADAAVTIGIGAIDDADRRLIATTDRALAAGIAAARPGARIGDISAAIEAVGRAGGYGIAEGLGGHGVGDEMHEDPSVPNVGRAGKGGVLKPGLVIAIEPMFTRGGDVHRTLADGWTIATADRSRAAHAEHTIAITTDGPEILTQP